MPSGLIVASRSFVKIPRAVLRQYWTHAKGRKYDTEHTHDNAVDIVSADHNHLGPWVIPAMEKFAQQVADINAHSKSLLLLGVHC
ncbi:hypothetical protein N7491_000807 [Penicillium cf. griseofulvum]|uniref:Uncharacterized protein n=1 Tax=Penicillium cf. griseofulvum TaxID=2972120 RepID=A0A9W9LXX8_9EURO|nr:hypothetical protein N7472_011214 [Penicillium cf. griseofulvum]KAJ5451625.1 hypothetical protein N7491_000807 [Penicillium cf. griseofulvum]